MVYSPSITRYDSIRYNCCGNRGLNLPAILLGLWHNFGCVDIFENARQKVLRAFDLGITHFYLVNNYDPPYGSAMLLLPIELIPRKDPAPTLTYI